MRLWGIKTAQDWGNMSEKISKMKFDDRESIEIGVARKQPLKRIAKLLNRHPSSITTFSFKQNIFQSVFAGDSLLIVKTAIALVSVTGFTAILRINV